jgi:hypothetical protein
LKAWEQVQKSFARKTTKIQGKEFFTGKLSIYVKSIKMPIPAEQPCPSPLSL